MSLLFLFLAVLSSLVIAVNVLASWLLWSNKEKTSPLKEATLPKVAVLIAARNEERNLERCLEAIEGLNYPGHLLSVWVGNDGSTDATFSIAKKICAGQSNWHLLDITEEWGRAKGKANVLAQLSRAAEDFADYFFITDADVAVVPDWILNILPYFQHNVGIVNGTTVVEGNHWFCRFQRFDWALALGLAKAYTYLPKFGGALTAIGNNMAIRKEVYREVGGYENIPFSVTEDYELYRQVNKLGYITFHSCIAGTKAYTKAAASFEELLHQRKRWMTGAMQLPLPMILILFVQAIFFPCILMLFIFQPLTGCLLFLLKLVSQYFLIRKMFSRLDEPSSSPFLLYELYSFFLSMSLLFFYLLPMPINWKGRKF